MIGALIGAAATIGSSLLGNKGAKDAAKAAQASAAAQKAGIQQGLNESGKLYDEGQSYLQPYIGSGEASSGLMHDIIGLNGPDAQARALEMYKSSPIAGLVDQAREESVRRTLGQYSASGLSRSGALTEDLARRLSDLDVNAYTNWQDLGKSIYGNESSQGYGAATQMSSNAINRGNTILNARTGQGTATASGIAGAANARLAGNNATASYLNNFAGKLSQNDFSFLPKGNSGGDVGLGSWAPTVWV